MTDVDLQSPQLFINRELSFLEFNRRVLAQAQDDNVPLLERVKFLAISCTNLDEFFEIRVAGLKQRRELGSLAPGPDGMDVDDQLEAIRRRSVELLDTQYALLNYAILPALEAAGIRVLRPDDWSPEQQEWIAAYFANEVEPVLTPLGLDPARPFPRIQNKSLNFIVELAGTDAFGRMASLAIVQVPRSLPRIIRLPSAGGAIDLIYLSQVIQNYVEQLFTGMEVRGCHQFRVTRNADLFVDDEETEDLMRAVQGELASRRYGDAVRLETRVDCPPQVRGESVGLVASEIGRAVTSTLSPSTAREGTEGAQPSLANGATYKRGQNWKQNETRPRRASKRWSGGGGNRTRVRSRVGKSVYKRSPGFRFARRPVPRPPTDGLAILRCRAAGDWLSLGAEPERWRPCPGLGPSQEGRRLP